MSREMGVLVTGAAAMVALLALFAICGQRFIAWYDEWSAKRENERILKQWKPPRDEAA